MTGLERAFLSGLASQKQGRASLSDESFEVARDMFSDLLAKGYVRERRLGFQQGFQLTDRGREYLAGAVE